MIHPNLKPILNIILVETALEKIPKSLEKKPSALKSIKRFGNAGKILDTTFHHSIMHNLEHFQKRGRPDILHHFLLDTLGSPANLSNHLKIYFHCQSGFYEVNSEMNCPRDYIRFKGLMWQLIKEKHIPPKKPPYFISKMDMNLNEWLEKNFMEKNTFLFTVNGENKPLKIIKSRFFIESNECAVLIGGFQKGHFSDNILKIPSQKYSISDRGYDSWIIVNRIIVSFEELLSLI